MKLLFLVSIIYYGQPLWVACLGDDDDDDDELPQNSTPFLRL